MNVGSVVLLGWTSTERGAAGKEREHSVEMLLFYSKKVGTLSEIISS